MKLTETTKGMLLEVETKKDVQERKVTLGKSRILNTLSTIKINERVE